MKPYAGPPADVWSCGVVDKGIFSMYIFCYSCLIFKYFGYVAQDN